MKGLIEDMNDSLANAERANKVFDRVLPVQLISREVVLVVDDDCPVIEIAKALASVSMTIQAEGPGRGRIVLTDEGIAQKLAAMEAARQSLLDRGMEP